MCDVEGYLNTLNTNKFSKGLFMYIVL